MIENEEIKKLKAEFIVDEKGYEMENIPHQIRRLSKFAKVGTEGKVFIISRDLAPDIRLKAILVSRFLANKLQKEINHAVSVEELSQYADLDKDQVRARMSNIVKEKFAKREGKGVFMVLPFQINGFIDEIDTVQGDK